MGIKHATTGAGTKVTNTIWAADHTVDGDVVPDADDSHDLGSSTAEWKDLYVDGTANIDAAVINSLEAYGNATNRGVTFVWKTTSEEALALSNQAAATSWTDLDLTAYTSANAKMAYLELHIQIDTATKDYSLGVRKNGTTPDNYPILLVYDGEAHAGDVFKAFVFVGLDTGNVCEYQTTVEGGGQADFAIRVLGYME